MDNNQNNETFQYTYSAKEQAELQKIRSKYLPKEESKMEQLRRLDASATNKATMKSIIIGLSGTLVMGLGMSLAMTELGAGIGMGMEAMAVGIVIGVIGMVLVGLAYPVYFRALKKEREKIAPEILRLTDELMK